MNVPLLQTRKQNERPLASPLLPLVRSYKNAEVDNNCMKHKKVLKKG